MTNPKQAGRIPVAVLGATGAVGQRMVSLLANHPALKLAEVAAHYALRERLRTLDAAIEAMRRDGVTRPLPGAEAERVFALSFAMRQLARDLDAFGADRRAPERAAAARA